MVDRNYQSWKVTKKVLDFKRFFDELCTQFPSYSHVIPFVQD